MTAAANDPRLDARRWIIDPIDGTANFIHGIPFFGALVALEEEGRIIAAAACNPILGKLAWALRGFGDYYGYLLVASARAEVMLDAHTAPWDLAAPKLLVEGAGGRLTGLDGTDSIYGDGAIASNGALHDSVLGLLRSMEDI